MDFLCVRKSSGCDGAVELWKLTNTVLPQVGVWFSTSSPPSCTPEHTVWHYCLHGALQSKFLFKIQKIPECFLYSTVHSSTIHVLLNSFSRRFYPKRWTKCAYRKYSSRSRIRSSTVLQWSKSRNGLDLLVTLQSKHISANRRSDLQILQCSKTIQNCNYSATMTPPFFKHTATITWERVWCL